MVGYAVFLRFALWFVLMVCVNYAVPRAARKERNTDSYEYVDASRLDARPETRDPRRERSETTIDATVDRLYRTALHSSLVTRVSSKPDPRKLPRPLIHTLIPLSV